MRRTSCLIGLALMLLGTDAAAEPEPCGVRLVRAPADVAPALASRLAALDACAAPLEVWIVRSDEGLYLVARDPLGRMRERMVPDLEVAAALIASWVEPGALDAEVVTPAASPAADVVVSAAPGTVTPAPDDEDPRPPSWRGEHAIAAAAPAAGRTFAIGGQVGVTWDKETTSGAHVEIELMRRGAAFVSFDGQLVQELGDSFYVVQGGVGALHHEEIGRTGLDALIRAGFQAGRRAYVRPSLAAGIGGSRHEILATVPNSFGFNMSETWSYIDWSYGLRVGFAVTAGIRFRTLAIEMSLTELASLQREKPGVSPDDRMVAAGVGLRFDR